ncbi:hypothetical protein JOE64_000739 [Microbacterium dextranolyticum]|nr:hypothetical protein [Microbacterium dextranolyticum]
MNASIRRPLWPRVSGIPTVIGSAGGPLIARSRLTEAK